MAKKPIIEEGDTILLAVPVSATWDDGRITIAINGIASTQRVTISGDSDSIVEVKKAPKDLSKRPLFDKPD